MTEDKRNDEGKEEECVTTEDKERSEENKYSDGNICPILLHTHTP